jgi:5-methyltetrahydropteroyltriglutamate--homocysteine methyltransferase
MELKAFAPGIYPRSEALVQATRDLERGRTTAETVEEQVGRDFKELVRVQEEAGLDLLSDGLLRWQDIFRPLAEASEGLDARPLTRFLDTNTFYRAVLVGGKPRLTKPLPAPDLPAGRWVATLPSPVAFSLAAQRDVSAEALAAGVLAPQVEAYAEAGCALVVLSEPFLAREVEDASNSLLLSDLRRALDELPRSVPVALHLVFGDAAGVLDGVADLAVEAVGIDFYATAAEAVPEGFPKEIHAGVVDSRSSAVEDAHEIASFAARLADRKPAGLALTVNGDLQFVPETIARRKLAVLGDSRAPLEVAA